MNNYKRYYDAVNYLESFINLPLKGGYVGYYLKRTRYFLNLIGNPDKDLSFIHITGTAGKGSVTNLIHEMISADGNRVGSFTSPYVSTSIEKIRVNDLYISPERFADIVDYLIPHIDYAYEHSPYGHPSYFEIFLAIALLYFKQEKCEWVVLEVGLGGRYDATNVVENTKVAVITNIDSDHREIIGPTLADIAYEKAGTIKPGCTLFTGEQRPQFLRLFEKICREKKVSFHHLKFGTDHRKNNLQIATAVATSIGIKEESIVTGRKQSKLQARFEVMQTNPTVIIDGAHNGIKMQSTVDNLRKLKYNKLHLIVGTAEGKMFGSMLKKIVPLADSVVFTRYQKKERKCTQPRALLKAAQLYLKKGSSVTIRLHSSCALKEALNRAKKRDIVLVTGSFFLAGELRKYWVSEEKILQTRTME